MQTTRTAGKTQVSTIADGPARRAACVPLTQRWTLSVTNLQRSSVKLQIYNTCDGLLAHGTRKQKKITKKAKTKQKLLCLEVSKRNNIKSNSTVLKVDKGSLTRLTHQQTISLSPMHYSCVCDLRCAVKRRLVYTCSGNGGSENDSLGSGLRGRHSEIDILERSRRRRLRGARTISSKRSRRAARS